MRRFIDIAAAVAVGFAFVNLVEALCRTMLPPLFSTPGQYTPNFQAQMIWGTAVPSVVAFALVAAMAAAALIWSHRMPAVGPRRRRARPRP
ncbi:MAG TPA: hypothetical protein VK821_12675 [Dehalococcoidia bacterium]|nr:hypothetical protein [Dehalococcoidia bacterium]